MTQRNLKIVTESIELTHLNHPIKEFNANCKKQYGSSILLSSLSNQHRRHKVQPQEFKDPTSVFKKIEHPQVSWKPKTWTIVTYRAQTCSTINEFVDFCNSQKQNQSRYPELQFSKEEWQSFSSMYAFQTNHCMSMVIHCNLISM